MKKLIYKIGQNTLIQHQLFWLLSFWVLLDMFAYSSNYEKTDYIYTFLFHLSLFFLVYMNVKILIPHLFEKGRYLEFVIGGIILVCFSAWLNHLTFSYLSDWLFAGYYFISYYEWIHLLQFMAAYFAISSLMKLSKSWFILLEKEQDVQRLKKEKIEAELLALKSQVNPHFLFNSLNNIYALALDREEEVPQLILELAQSMRYMLYECNETFIPLDKELEFLGGYIRLQKRRSDHEANIEFEIKGNAEGCCIAPLLFLPFIENGFKHGIKGKSRKTFILISVLIKENEIMLNVVNSLAQQIYFRESEGGIGLENVKKRLELIYPSRHQLEIKKESEQFIVNLKIKDVKGNCDR